MRVLSDQQIEAVFQSLTGQGAAPFGAIEPFGPLVEALHAFKGTIVVLRHGETPYSEGAVKRATGGLAGLNESEPQIFPGLVSAYAPDANGTVRLLNAARQDGSEILLSTQGENNTKAFAASDLGHAFRKVARDALVAVSPLGRAQETAEIVLDKATKARLVTATGLAEIYLGQETGLTLAGADGVKARVDTPNYQLNGGENTSDYTDKVILSLTDLITRASAQDKDLVIVGHSQWAAVALAGLLTLTNGAVVQNENDWNGKVESYVPLVVSRPVSGERVIHALGGGVSVGL